MNLRRTVYLGCVLGLVAYGYYAYSMTVTIKEPEVVWIQKGPFDGVVGYVYFTNEDGALVRYNSENPTRIEAVYLNQGITGISSLKRFIKKLEAGKYRRIPDELQDAAHEEFMDNLRETQEQSEEAWRENKWVNGGQ